MLSKYFFIKKHNQTCFSYLFSVVYFKLNLIFIFKNTPNNLFFNNLEEIDKKSLATKLWFNEIKQFCFSKQLQLKIYTYAKVLSSYSN